MDNEMKKRMELVGKVADMFEDIEPQEASRIFFTALMILGKDVQKAGDALSPKLNSKLN